MEISLEELFPKIFFDWWQVVLPSPLSCFSKWKPKLYMKIPKTMANFTSLVIKRFFIVFSSIAFSRSPCPISRLVLQPLARSWKGYARRYAISFGFPSNSWLIMLFPHFSLETIKSLI